jgi:formate hydrogenlyase subunit 4
MCFYGFLKLIAKEEWLPAKTGNFFRLLPGCSTEDEMQT